MNFLRQLGRSLLVFDGAMGTSIQQISPTSKDFGGDKYIDCNEHLVLSNPQIISKIHCQFLEKGCHVIETNTFGANSLTLQRYQLAHKCKEINLQAAHLAREAADAFSSPADSRFVAGSIGPTSKLPSLGHIEFGKMVHIYLEQVEALVEGGVDLLLVETCQDLLQTRAAVTAILQNPAFLAKPLPIVVSLTIEEKGSMLLGTEMGAALAVVESLPYVSAIGLNCGCGPGQLMPQVKYLAENSSLPILVMPNAGLPRQENGQTIYPMRPAEMSRWMHRFVTEMGVEMVGGCCGTTPAHLESILNGLKGVKRKVRKVNRRYSLTSNFTCQSIKTDLPPLLVGERCNATGSKKFKKLLQQDGYDLMLELATRQVEGGSHLLDISLALAGRDEVKDANHFFPLVNLQIKSPVMIDSGSYQVVQSALESLAGRSVFNSLSLEEGETRVRKFSPLLRKFGAAVVLLTIDQQGMALTLERKLEVTHQLYQLCTQEFGFSPQDLFFDPLTFSVASGQENLRGAGRDTLAAVAKINKNYPLANTILGISNISHGLAPSLRPALNSIFLYHATKSGLTAAIVHSRKILPLYKIDHQLRQLCEDLLFDRRRYDADGNCIYDPLEELLKKTGSFHLANFNEDRENLNWHQRITRNIMEGKKSSLNEDLQDALEKMDAIKIINKLMVPAMADVGKLFEKGETQLPFVLKSAEVISRALEILKPHLQGKKVMDRGVVLLATVQGDIHDIGKNLAKIILTSNGFQVKDLGVNVTCEKIIKAIKEINPVALGLSALLVKSTQAMRHTLQMLDSHNLTLPVIVGGAPLSADFVTQDLSPAYRGPVYYAKDAVSALKILKKDDLETEDGQDIESKAAGSKVTKPQDTDLEIANSALLNKTMQQKLQKAVSLDAPDLVKIVPLIKNNMLKKLWGMATKGGPANTSAQEILQDFQHYRQTMEKMAQKAGRIKPKTISIFLPMTCLDHKLIIKANNSYHLQKLIKLIGKSPEDLLYFNFRPGPKNSILKHFSASPLVDIGALMVVSIGLQATLFQQELEQRGNFLEMFLWHGFCASLTEALAQYQHDQLALCYNRVIAAEIDENQNFITLKQQTRRFSPGYPSWPDLFEQRKIFAILNPAKIGVQLSDTCQLQPEYSISALISFHKHETENRREKI